MRIGILTGGGDTPSLNAILYGASQTADLYKGELIGFKKGWEGILGTPSYLELKKGAVDPTIGGTILKSSRTRPTNLDELIHNIETTVDALIAIGGDDTLSIATEIIGKLSKPICLVTKTIDNDVGINAPDKDLDYEAIVNYFTTGFATAANKVATYANELKTTAYSHERIMFLEAMGRTPGWLALASYKAKPDFIIVPEFPLDFERFKEALAKKYTKQGYAIVVVAEGARYTSTNKPISEDNNNQDVFGHAKLGGVAEILATRVKNELNIKNSNYINPNYLYRSGPPSELDKNTSIYLGKLATRTVLKEITGQVCVLQRHQDEIIAQAKHLDKVLNTNSGKIIPRNLDSRFYDPDSYCITEAGKKYFELIR